MSKVNKSQIVEHLKLLRFKLVKEGETNNWVKQFENCKIMVNLESGWIDYPEKLKIHHLSTSKLLDPEDFVVLECVVRLLTLGYPADKIELEKTWNVGVNESGRLDILVRSKDSKDIYLMIECKTYDSYDRAFTKMMNNGGQLFSYLQQEKSTKIVSLYASWISKFRMRYCYTAVPVEQSIRSCNNMEEMYENWVLHGRKCVTGGDYDNDAVFGENVGPYEICI